MIDVAKEKYTKAEVGFEHPAGGNQRCAGCVHFEADRLHCELVAGRILPGDWCREYEAKTQEK